MSPRIKRRIWFTVRYAAALPAAAWLGWNLGRYITDDFRWTEWQFAPQALAAVPAVLLVINRKRITRFGKRLVRSGIIIRKRRSLI